MVFILTYLTLAQSYAVNGASANAVDKQSYQTFRNALLRRKTIGDRTGVDKIDKEVDQHLEFESRSELFDLAFENRKRTGIRTGNSKLDEDIDYSLEHALEESIYRDAVYNRLLTGKRTGDRGLDQAIDEFLADGDVKLEINRFIYLAEVRFGSLSKVKAIESQPRNESHDPASQGHTNSSNLTELASKTRRVFALLNSKRNWLIPPDNGKYSRISNQNKPIKHSDLSASSPLLKNTSARSYGTFSGAASGTAY